MQKHLLLILISCGALISQAHGAEVAVSSVAQLQSAIKSAQAGDTVILANGIYTNNTIAVTTNNITVRAETPGGVFLNGSNTITIPANGVLFSGFQFTSGSIPVNVIEVKGNNNTLTQLNFNGYSAQKYVVFKAGSQRNAVTYSNFQNKPVGAPQGNLIESEADPVIGYHTISHNSFQHLQGRGGDNGNECIRLGEGSQSAFISRTVVEYNYFEDTGAGDSEAISVKSRENTLRWNTMNKNPDAMFVFRNGNNNLAYGNFFIDAGGIRVKEANNIYCYNNYFERAGIGGSMNAVTYDYISPNLRNINFIHNTFVEPGLISLAEGATNNTWANNVIRKSSGRILTAAPAGITWVGNLYSGALGVSIPSGLTGFADLGLKLNADNYFGLSSTSPAINSGQAFPEIYTIPGIEGDYSLALDISGRVRDAAKDAGCAEFSATGPALNRPLSLADVGPVYLQRPVRTFNAAGFQEGAIAQDSIVTLFGSGLALRTEAYDGSAVTTLGDAVVNVIDSKGVSRPAQLFFANPGQINFLLPAGTAAGMTVIIAAKSAGCLGADVCAAQVGSALVTASAPGIFTVSGNSTVPAAFYLRVTGANQRVTDYVFDPKTLAAVDIPRAVGDQIYLLLYGTGFRHSPQITATANGQIIPVLGAVAQSEYAGLDQVNIGPLPAGLASGMVTVRLFDEGRPANTITVRVQ